MKKIVLSLLLLLSMSAAVAAKKGETQANAFQHIYFSTCIQYLTHLEDLREKMQGLPHFPPEQAEQFLLGKQGKAWAIPGQPGEFVLVLEDNKDFCAVYARKLDVERAQQTFIDHYQQPTSAHLVAEKILDEKVGERHSISYNWFVPNATRKLNFMLTVSSAKAAPVQALFTAAIIRETP